MRLVRYVRDDDTDARPRVGVLDGPAVPDGDGAKPDGVIRPIPGAAAMADLLALPLGELRARTEQAAATPGPDDLPADRATLLPPVDGRTEVWASGVTYARSRDARMEESTQADIYDLVHTAERPELFFKSPAWRTVTTGEPVGIRADSALNVPEPELALVLNAFGEIAGHTVCNDVSSRTIEGENPLYLPQAKVYAGACALAPGIRPAWEVPAPDALTIDLAVVRDGATAFAGTTSTTRIRRPLATLAEHLFRADDFPDGAVLATGTGIVPDLDFTLRDGDEITITVENVGRLVNTVVTGKAPFAALLGGRPLP